MKLTKSINETQSVDNDFYVHRLNYGVHQPILSQTSPFWELSFDEKKSLITPYLQEYEGYNLCWVEEYEAHYLEGVVGDGVQPCIPFFEEMGIDITYKTNALGGNGYKYLKHEPISYWLGKNAWKDFEIPESRTFQKSFLYMNRVRKRWREEVFFRIYEERLLDYCDWSWASNDINDPLHKSIEGIAIEDEMSHLEMDLLPQFNTTFCSVVPETFFSNDGVSNEATFITEKTEKCFATGHPFIIVSTPYFLKNLQQMGFKTFGRWWDETYDETFDVEERIDRIMGEMHRISQLSNEQKQRMYKEMLPTLKHNQKHNKYLYHKYWKEGRDWLEFNDDFHWQWIPKPPRLI